MQFGSDSYWKMVCRRLYHPITHDGKNQLLNTNADTIAQEIAKAMTSSYDVTLIYGFEKSGVLLDVENEHSVIPVLNSGDYNKLKEI